MTGVEPLLPGQADLIESGAVSLREVLDANRLYAAQDARAAAEEAVLVEWDRTHCPACGADWRIERDHCRG